MLGNTEALSEEIKCINYMKGEDFSHIFQINKVSQLSLNNFNCDTWETTKHNLLKELPRQIQKNPIICITDKPLDGNYFRKKLRDNISIITLYQAREICAEANTSIQNYILRHLYKTAIRYLLSCNPTSKAIKLNHQRTKGCMWDFCGDDKYHVVLGFNRICPKCENTLKNAILPSNFIELLKNEFSFRIQQNLSYGEISNKKIANNGGSATMLDFKFNDITVDNNLVFVLMPFTETWSEYIWTEQIRKIVESIDGYSLVCKRADDLYGHDVMRDVVENILKARIIVADITNRNANVFYELGIAHAFNKDFVLLTQDVEHIPFDLNRYRHCIYSNTGLGYIELKKGLSNSIIAILKDDSSPTYRKIH